MEDLFKITEIVRKYGISVRTIRYYEEVGLIKSIRTNYYAYRMYDKKSVETLEQILFLRKLGISTKDIKIILNTSNPNDIINIISSKKEKILEDIANLNDIKLQISQWIGQVKNSTYNTSEILSRCKAVKTDEIDLNDLEHVSGISRKNISGLNRLYMEDGMLHITVSDDTRLAVSENEYTTPLTINIRAKTDNENLRLYFGEYRLIFNWEKQTNDELIIKDALSGAQMLVSGKGRIPKDTFVDITWNIGNENMEVFLNGERLYRCVYTNTSEFSVSEKIGVSSAFGSTVTVSDINVISEGLRHKVKLESMKWHQSEHSVKDGVLTVYNVSDDEAMNTPKEYSLPLRIDVTAMVKDRNLRIYYNKGFVILNWEADMHRLVLKDVAFGVVHDYNFGGYISPGEYHDITWIISNNFTALIVDGITRLYNENHEYIGFLKDHAIKGKAGISSAFGGTVSVKSFKVTELEGEDKDG